jgi:hypothetical protein
VNDDKFRVHRSPLGGVIATERILDHFIAYHLNDLGSFDFEHVAFGHGITHEAAIADLQQRKRAE